jgi:hypothetical protein
VEHGKLISVAIGVGAWLIAAALNILHGPQWLGLLFLVVGFGFIITAGLWWAHGSFQSPDTQQSHEHGAGADTTGPPQVAEHEAVQRQDVTTPQTPELIFDEAPPELAGMTTDSLRALLAGRTNAQIHKLMEQHLGKLVRVSGEVEVVDLGVSVASVKLKTPIPLLLFFDTEKGYDPEPVLLTLNEGDKIVASGQIRKFEQSIFMGFVGLIVALDHCRLVEARRVS